MIDNNKHINLSFISSIVNIAANPFIAIDDLYNITLFNQAAESTFGYVANEIIGQKLVSILPQFVNGNKDYLINNCRKNSSEIDDNNHDFKITWKIKDGSNFDASALMLSNIDNGIVLISIDNHPITASSNAQELMKSSELRYRRLFETAKDGIIILDAENGNIVDVNPFLVKLLGFSKEDFVEKKIWEIGFFHDLVANKEKFIELQKQEYVRYDDLPLETKTGNKVYVEFVSNVYLVDNKKVIQCNIRDITQRKLKDKELIISKLKAEENDRLKTAFLQNISHEIRTPLNGILGFSSLLKNENNTSDDIKEFSSLINQSGNRLLEIVNNVMDISKIQTGQVVIENKPIAIESIFSDLINLFATLSKEKNIALKYLICNDLPKIIISDESKFYQILSNLIKNAFKFTVSGSIDFGYTASDDMFQFYVKDTGIGIRESMYSKIFDRFIQAETSITRDYEGAGLGLAICKGYVELMGGRIWVESEENVGSTFFFTLPKNKLHHETGKIVRNIETHKKFGNIIILIAEDDLVSYLYLKRVLQKHDIKFLHAEDGDQAIKLVKSNPEIDLVLMDIRMPLIDGLEATKIIKKLRPELPIIAQTAYAFKEERTHILSIGCDEYLVKPIEESKLLVLLNKFLN